MKIVSTVSSVLLKDGNVEGDLDGWLPTIHLQRATIRTASKDPDSKEPGFFVARVRGHARFVGFKLRGFVGMLPRWRDDSAGTCRSNWF